MKNKISDQLPTLSYWENQAFFSNIDIAIIGSGIVGLTTAIYLKQLNPKLNVAIFERGTLPLGASTRNAGFACFGSMTELIDDLSKSTEEEVFTLVAARWNGLANLRVLLGDEKIGFKMLGGYEVFREKEADTFEECHDRMAHFNKILKPIIGQKEVFTAVEKKITQFGFSGIRHMILNSAEGQINTGAMMKNLIKLAEQLDVISFYGITINQLVENPTGVSLITDQGWEIKVNQVLVATNGFARKLIKDISLSPARNQVLITKPIRHLPFKGTFHMDKGYYYFRSVEDTSTKTSRILLGGGRNLYPEQEATEEFGNTENIQTALSELLFNTIAPNASLEIDYWWSGILGVGSEKKPIVQMHSPRIGVAVRMGGMGVAIGSKIGQQAAHMLLDK